MDKWELIAIAFFLTTLCGLLLAYLAEKDAAFFCEMWCKSRGTEEFIYSFGGSCTCIYDFDPEVFKNLDEIFKNVSVVQPNTCGN